MASTPASWCALDGPPRSWPAAWGLSLPVRLAAHVRLTFALPGEPPPRLACLQDGGGDFGEVGVYAAPLPGNRSYAPGLSQTVDVQEDGSLLDPASLTALSERASGYARRALPRLDPAPVDYRHCWVTELPRNSPATTCSSTLPRSAAPSPNRGR